MVRVLVLFSLSMVLVAFAFGPPWALAHAALVLALGLWRLFTPAVAPPAERRFAPPIVSQARE